MDARKGRDAESGSMRSTTTRRWVVERSFSWLARFRRLSRDFECIPQVLAGLHFVVFAILMLPQGCHALGFRAGS